jgi:hypothetical protein
MNWLPDVRQFYIDCFFAELYLQAETQLLNVTFIASIANQAPLFDSINVGHSTFDFMFFPNRLRRYQQRLSCRCGTDLDG